MTQKNLKHNHSSTAPVFVLSSEPDAKESQAGKRHKRKTVDAEVKPDATSPRKIKVEVKKNE